MHVAMQQLALFMDHSPGTGRPLCVRPACRHLLGPVHSIFLLMGLRNGTVSKTVRPKRCLVRPVLLGEVGSRQE
jgi:hypothetical protein